jgi:hypothetical protein
LAGWSDRFQRFSGRDPDQPDRHFRSLKAASSEDLSPSHDLPVMLGLHVPYPISYLVILSNNSIMKKAFFKIDTIGLITYGHEVTRSSSNLSPIIKYI